MFGFDTQMQVANSFAKAMTDTTSAMMQSTAAFWAPPKPDPAKSWYRAPASASAAPVWPFAAMAMPSSGMGWPQTNAMTPFSAQQWSALASFAQMMAAIQPMQSYWMSFVPGQAAQQPPMATFWQAMMLPIVQWSSTAQAATDAAYAIYRSDGGHATAQIIFPGETKPSWRSTQVH